MDTEAQWSDEVEWWFPGTEHDRADYDIPCNGWDSMKGLTCTERYGTVLVFIHP